MMGLFSQWLLGITGTTLLIAVSDSLMPTGAVKQVGKLISGLVLFLMMVQPFAQDSGQSLAQVSAILKGGFSEEQEIMENYYNQQIKTIIEQQLASYIVDKAREVEIECHVVVRCVLEEVYTPVSVEVIGVSLEQQGFFSTMIVEDLGVAADGITFKEVEDENLENPPHITSMERGDSGV